MSFPVSPTLGTTHVVGSSEYKWNGYAWDVVVPYTPTSNTITTTEITATAGQTVFNCTYNPSYVEVLVNGMQLSKTDYTATNGTTVVLNVGATLGDLVVIREYDTFAVADVYTKTETYTKTEIDNALDSKANITDVLAKAGGTMTGAITSLRETSVAMAASDIDLSAGNHFTKTISGATTLTLSNIPASGQVASFVLQLTNGGSATVTWFSGVKWAGGTAPTLTAAGVDSLGFISNDGGTTWNGFKLGMDMK